MTYNVFGGTLNLALSIHWALNILYTYGMWQLGLEGHLHRNNSASCEKFAFRPSLETRLRCFCWNGVNCLNEQTKPWLLGPM